MADPMKPVIAEIIRKEHQNPGPPNKWNGKKSEVQINQGEYT